MLTEKSNTMANVQIHSVSPAAAKRALDKIVSSNGMIYTSADYTSANSSVLTVSLHPADCHIDEQDWHDPDAPLTVVDIRSNYYGEVSLGNYAEEVKGRGTVKVIA